MLAVHKSVGLARVALHTSIASSVVGCLMRVPEIQMALCRLDVLAVPEDDIEVDDLLRSAADGIRRPMTGLEPSESMSDHTEFGLLSAE